MRAGALLAPKRPTETHLLGTGTSHPSKGRHVWNWVMLVGLMGALVRPVADTDISPKPLELLLQTGCASMPTWTHRATRVK